VIAVSCDLRSPRLHSLFRLGNEVGLTAILSGHASTEEVAQGVPGVSGLLVIPSGPVHPHPAEILGSDQMGRLLSQLRSAADFVVIDTPPLLPVSDALILVPWSDGVLVVADSTATTWSATLRAREQLEQVDGNVVGCVLNKLDPAKATRSVDLYREHGNWRGQPQAQPPGGDGRSADQASVGH
jgi:non-specific protein-tyrosine kinase